ncbi:MULTISPECIES: amidase [unclassified Acinetobacter]|uniref:amidase n=1 Tax=unclassified Acinetobacter TaxID=196816 RepID=UPI002934C24B|nr:MULTISPECIES: amidase [unclassified Acinetobacter]WOE32207.1 amidase [Acinetobacter sp. SAAs470]WOE37677.1 amidase [Acinetobacter sp. SAAs474]
METQWFNQSLSQLIAALDTEKTDLETIINAFYRRIEHCEEDVQAWQYLVPKTEYLNQYYAQEAFYKNSILKGLPFAIKDVIDTAGIPTRMGSRIYTNRIPVIDAAVVTAIKQAGGIILGKTVTTEFALFKVDKTRNPHDINRTPGGSSSGSAAAVADFMVPFALGTQTAASVIRPASYCGCLAYVGSHQQFSLRNIQPLAQSLDSLGMFAQSFADIRLMRQVLQLRPTTYQAHPLAKVINIALCSGEQFADIDVEMQRAFLDLQRQLSNTRIQYKELPNSIDLSRLGDHHIQIMAYEVARNLQSEYETGMLDHTLMALIEQGLRLPYTEYLKHLQQVQYSKERYIQWISSNDIHVTMAPAATGIAPLGLQETGKPSMSRPWQVMGLPVTTFPMAYCNQLPLGVQLIGYPQQDDELLEVSEYLYHLLLSHTGV